ncbi:MAG: hypothetical protein ACFE0R_04200 [Salinarimonas sp.]
MPTSLILRAFGTCTLTLAALGLVLPLLPTAPLVIHCRLASVRARQHRPTPCSASQDARQLFPPLGFQATYRDGPASHLPATRADLAREVARDFCAGEEPALAW